MTLTVSKKLILSFLGLTLVVLIATLGLARWSFERGFLDYMNALEQDRLSSLAENLAQEYQAAGGSWATMTPQLFDELLGDSIPGGPPPGPPQNDGHPLFPNLHTYGPPPRRAPGGERNHLDSDRPREAAKGDHNRPEPDRPHEASEGDNNRPDPGGSQETPEANDSRPEPDKPHEVSEGGDSRPDSGRYRGRIPPPMARRFPPPPGRPGHNQGPPTALFEAGGQQIAGMIILDSVRFPTTFPIMANGKRIGELQSAPIRHFDAPKETAFSRQQLNSSLTIGAISLALAAVVSWLLARLLLAPIRRMIFGVSQLSSGDYSVRLNEHRNDELGQLMGDLDRLAYKLEENQASRRRWLADISHELRTPVTVLTGEIETLKDGIRPLDMEQVLSLDQEITRLRKLIDDLYELSVSEIGGLRYSFYPVNVRDDLDKVVRLIRKRAHVQGIDICVSGETDAMISADSQRLDQLFSNLVENALAYSDSPGKIEIALSNDGQRVSIIIEDTPPGVDENECDKLFDPLYRQDASRSRRTAGAGLGLAICQNIVIAHQGTISASPSKLGGLCIEMHFPTLTEL